MKKWPLLGAALFLAVVAFLVYSGCSRSGPNATTETNAPPSAPAPAPPKTIALIHFAGAKYISSNTNSVAFEKEFCSTQAVALENQTLDKLSRAPGTWFKDKLPTGTADGSAQLRPLLDDFLKSEWVFEMQDGTPSPEYALAIRLDADRAQLWQDNLRTLLESWTKITATNIPGGWELKKDLPPNLFRMVRTNDWLVIGCGQDQLPLSDEWAQEGNIPQNDGNWLSVNLDWPRLGQIFPALAQLDFPQIQMQVAGTNRNLQLTGKFDLSQPLPPLEAWQVPTNIIHQPLTSFTAARGFGPWLTNQSWAGPFQLSPKPEQLFIWSLGAMPLQTFIAVPVPNATNALAQLDRNLTENTNWETHLMSPFGISMTNNRIYLPGVPFIAPELQALQEKTGDILFGDVFPNLPFGKPPPPEIMQPLTQSNLVFYHWENTSVRLSALPQLTQLALLLTKHRQLWQNSASAEWLNQFGPSLGPCTTVVTQTAPSELSFSRTAPGGLTAVEFIALENWLEAPNFPGCDLSLPNLRFRQLHRPLKKLGAPAPPPHPH